MIDAVGMVEWLFATLLGFVTEDGMVGIPVLVVVYLIMTGWIVPAPWWEMRRRREEEN